MLQLDNFYKARFVLSKVIRKTELVHTPRINPESDVYLKPECLQKTGSFKIRGAYYKISQLTDEEKAKGVIACSAGNHAQGVALGATVMGVKSLICLPEGAPISKVEATKRLGAEVCLVPGVYDDAYQKALELKDKHGYTFVHPFDDENVIAGQGTIGLEIIDQLPDVEAVVVPVGGGGLISGVAFAIKSLNPHVKVAGRGSLRHRKPGRQHHGSSSRPFCQPQQGECLRAPCHHGDPRRGTRKRNQGGFGIKGIPSLDSITVQRLTKIHKI